MSFLNLTTIVSSKDRTVSQTATSCLGVATGGLAGHGSFMILLDEKGTYVGLQIVEITWFPEIFHCSLYVRIMMQIVSYRP